MMRQILVRTVNTPEDRSFRPRAPTRILDAFRWQRVHLRD
jgi:hypothetical protein